MYKRQPEDIAIHCGHRNAKADGANGPGRVIPDAGQGEMCIRDSLNTEYNVEIRMQQLPFEQLRWVKNDPDTYNLRDLDLTSDTKAVEDLSLIHISCACGLPRQNRQQ